MNIQDIYKDKQKVIEKVCSKAMSTLFDTIDKDQKYDLCTDEIIELCEELITMWCWGGATADASKMRK